MVVSSCGTPSTAVSASAINIVRRSSCTKVCCPSCLRSIAISPLDGSSAKFNGVGTLLYQGVVQAVQADISSLSKKSIKVFAMMLRPHPEIATSRTELLSTKQINDIAEMKGRPRRERHHNGKQLCFEDDCFLARSPQQFHLIF